MPAGSRGRSIQMLTSLLSRIMFANRAIPEVWTRRHSSFSRTIPEYILHARSWNSLRKRTSLSFIYYSPRLDKRKKKKRGRRLASENHQSYIFLLFYSMISHCCSSESLSRGTKATRTPSATLPTIPKTRSSLAEAEMV